jgi:hypothetical protein
MQPDEDLDFILAAVGGSWAAHVPRGPGVARLSGTELRVTSQRGGGVAIPYSSIAGGAWQTGRLVLHGRAGRLELEAEEGLERAWIVLVARACPVPEFTRGLRMLGSRRAGGHEAQLRFFAPLLQARRRVEVAADLEERLAAFDAQALSERWQQVASAIAAEAHPGSAPERRALEAELLEASEGTLEALNAVGQAATRFREAGAERCFDAWRSWASAVAAAFGQADRAWGRMVTMLPEPRMVNRSAVGPRRFSRRRRL